MSLAAGTRLGSYEVLGLIGAGGMGEVYKARDTRLDRDVAIKVLPADVATDPERRRRFEHEARAVSALNHPHICTLYDIGSTSSPQAAGVGASSSLPDPPLHYLVMEFLDGQTLGARLTKGPLPLAQALDVAAQIADALDAARKHGIVHRDLKPGNVILTTGGAGRSGVTSAKLLDFGLAKLTAHGERPALVGDASAPTQTAPITARGTILGTLPYMAPEQLEGKEADARTDLWALGAVLHEMVTGRRAFEGESQVSLIGKIMNAEPADLATLQPLTPPALARVVTRCLAKHPDDRWDTAHDVADELRWIAQSSSSPLATSAVTATGRRWTRRRVLLASAVALVIVAAVVAVFAPRIVRPTPRSPVAGGSPSVLALPCKVFGAPEVAFLTDAVPGTISTLLSGVVGLDTKVPPSSLEVEKVKGDLGRLAELYQVSSFIVTSLTASPGRFALNVQLVDAATRSVRWGQQYEGPREAYNELARQAAEGIRQAVRPATAPVQAAGVSSEAELAYRQGMYFRNRYFNFYDQRDFDLALAAFQRALELGPGLADAAGKIANLYVGRFQSGTMPARETIPAIERWAARALAISPCSVGALSALGAVELERPVASTRRMVEYGLKAASCGPADGRSQFFLGYGADPAGLTSVAIAAYLECYRLEPLFVYAPYNAAFWLRGLGRPEEALRLLDQALTTEPGMPLLLFDRVVTLVDLGRLLNENEGRR